MRWLLIPFVLTCCVENSTDIAAPIERIQPQSRGEIEFAKSVLEDLQQRSFENNREYCGYIGINQQGEFVASKPTEGTKKFCRADEPDPDLELLASYHTHGGYSQDHDSEVPSLDDLQADISEGVDGYVATPGGRVWFNNAEEQTSRLLCGVKCIQWDESFQEDYEVPDFMNLQDHKEW
ncbi:hypothetical protein GCM10007939_09520 [Amylibacter marinus]|uniref:DUF4329 domain-containing protein n=1 Tax=Amylibacter marinus TaxID=1475483 RepID=A0ABQ5VU41_9RHOB|nr:DUF4329 domain-containing protein [Amylibacter marinus]GLQ34669.1 hypothetical protein GCM10007939_09520 [Amylibacter marinus]